MVDELPTDAGALGGSCSPIRDAGIPPIAMIKPAVVIVPGRPAGPGNWCAILRSISLGRSSCEMTTGIFFGDASLITVSRIQGGTRGSPSILRVRPRMEHSGKWTTNLGLYLLQAARPGHPFARLAICLSQVVRTEINQGNERRDRGAYG